MVNTLFAHDTIEALQLAVGLVNTGRNGKDNLPDVSALNAFLDEHDFSGRRTGSSDELARVKAVRERLDYLWDATEDDAVRVVNAIMRDANGVPQLVKHDGYDYHLHATTPDAPLSDRIATEAAMAFLDVIRFKALDRLQVCSAKDCQDRFIDYSKNRSKRYCDAGNCQNRSNVRAYRARKSDVGKDSE